MTHSRSNFLRRPAERPGGLFQAFHWSRFDQFAKKRHPVESGVQEFLKRLEKPDSGLCWSDGKEAFPTFCEFIRFHLENLGWVVLFAWSDE